MSKVRKKFWKESRDLVDGCNGHELHILRNMVAKAIEVDLNAGMNKLLTRKKDKLLK